MDEDIEKKQFDLKVMAKMKDLGIIDHFNAYYLSNFSVLVQDSNLTSLQMYKDVNKSTNFQIAAEFVLQYLKNNEMNFTLNSFAAETKNQIPQDQNIASKELNFTSNDYLDEALNFYFSDEEKFAKIKKAKHLKIRKELAGRIESLKNSHSPKH